MANQPTPETPLPARLAQVDTERMRRYRENLAFYHGEQWGSQRSVRRSRRLTFNYARALIDKTASYAMAGMALAVDPADSSAAERRRAALAERLLGEVHEANQLDQVDFDTEVDAAVLGDAAYKVTWDPSDGRVRVAAVDVQGLYAWWLGDDVSRVWRVAQQYTLSGEEARMLYPELASQKAEYRVTELWTEEAFEIWCDTELTVSAPNPYGVIPYVIYPNIREPKQFWGVSDIQAFRESAVELNRAMTQVSQILELSGNPIAVLEGITESTDIAVQPGAVWEIPPEAKAYLLDLLAGNGVGLHIDYLDRVYRTLHDLAEMPRAAFGDEKAVARSGVAMQLELDPLVKKVGRKRLIRAAAFRRRAALVLRLLDRFTGTGVGGSRVRVVWGGVLPPDRRRQVEDEATLVALGVHSRRRAGDELGVTDPDAEFQAWLREERAVRALGNGHTPPPAIAAKATPEEA